jgi:hypothetical protein
MSAKSRKKRRERIKASRDVNRALKPYTHRASLWSSMKGQIFIAKGIEHLLPEETKPQGDTHD